MGDPTSRAQPEQRWSMFYAPEVTQGTSMNDTGGVHVNSSLLNIVSYKLDKAGMSVEDQGYFWMNVAMAMVPTTDFAQMAELLPWVMERLGFNQYVSALNQAIDEAGYTKLEQPSELPAGAGAITFTYPDMEANEKGLVHVLIVSDATAVEAWPAGRTALVRQVLPADDYFVAVIVGEDPATATGKVYTDKGWIDYDYANESVSNKGTLVHVEEGKTAELATDGLA